MISDSLKLATSQNLGVPSYVYNFLPLASAISIASLIASKASFHFSASYSIENNNSPFLPLKLLKYSLLPLNKGLAFVNRISALRAFAIC